MRREFWKTLVDCLTHNRRALPYVMMMVALYLHLGPFSRHVIAQVQRQIDTLIDAQSTALPARLDISKAAVAGPV